MADQIIITTFREWDFERMIRKIVENAVAELVIKAAAVMPDEILTTEEAAIFMKVSKATINKWRKDNLIEAIYFGKSIRYKKSDLFNVKEKKARRRAQRNG